MSRSDYNRALFEARMSSMSDVELRMPWETGIMKQIFDSDDESAFPQVLPPVHTDYFMPVSASGAETPDQEGMEERPTVKSLVRSDASLPFLFVCNQSGARQRHIYGGNVAVGESNLEVVANFQILGFPGMLGHSLLSEQVGTTWIHRACFCVTPWA